MNLWLQAIRHDLVKRAVWPARDLRESGGRDVASLRRYLIDTGLMTRAAGVYRRA